MLYQNLATRTPRPAQSEPKRKPRRHWWLIIFLLVGFVGYNSWNNHVSAQNLAVQRAQAATAKQKAGTFSSQVNALIAANPAISIGVAVASSDSTLQTYGSTAPFDGASTAKLLTAADLLTHVEHGTASLQQDIDGQTAQHWLQTMLVNSDDTAWVELNGFLTHDDLQAYAQRIGFTAYDPDVNTFTASDVALLLQKLYTGQLLKNSDRSLLLNYLKQANYRQYIVAAVPEGDSVYHKVGLDDDNLNDAAIITHGQKYLVLVIFTDGNGTYDWPARTQLIHSLTQDATTAYL